MKIKENLPKIYLFLFAIFWIILAINPLYRFMWFIENVLMLIFLAVLILTYKKLRFSNLTYTLVLAFLVLQTIGAHYTYSSVPMEVISNLFGWERNNFDRIVHFSFGFLLTIPFREWYMRTSKCKSKLWLFVVPVMFAFATGAVYEIIEWIFAVFSDPTASAEFLGSQGDIWDAQKDTFLAGVGAIVVLVTQSIVNVFRKH